MPLRLVLLLAVLALLAVFVAVNWTAFTMPTTLSLVVAQVEAPLGVVMLVVTGAVALLFLAYAVVLQAGTLRELRRMAREVEAQRRLADEAEASRFTELRAHLDRTTEAIGARVDQAVNGLAAQVAELDDRLAHPDRPPRT